MADPDQSAAPSAREADQRGDVDAFDLLIVAAKRKRLLLGFPFAVAVIAAVVAILLPNYYTGITKIIPPQQSGSTASALLNQLSGALGGLASLAGGAAGLKSPGDMYVGMLKSRTVADNLIERFDLNKLYGEEYQSKTRTKLEDKTKITAGKDGIIVIEFDDKDPKRAADVANAYVDELMKLTTVLAVTEASQRRLFFEKQLLQAKDNLAAAEVAARQGLEKGGITYADAQGRSMLEVTARLRAQVSAKEVQLGAMRTFAAEGNPDLQRTREELDALRRELARVEGSAPTLAKDVDSSKGGFDNVSRLRNVKYYEFLYELLAKQYELAKVDEARDSTVVQVVDKAIPPDRKSKPYRALIVLVSGIVGGLLAIFLAFFFESLDKARADPRQAGRLETLKRYLKWR